MMSTEVMPLSCMFRFSRRKYSTTGLSKNVLTYSRPVIRISSLMMRGRSRSFHFPSRKLCTMDQLASEMLSLAVGAGRATAAEAAIEE